MNPKILLVIALVAAAGAGAGGYFAGQSRGLTDGEALGRKAGYTEGIAAEKKRADEEAAAARKREEDIREAARKIAEEKAAAERAQKEKEEREARELAARKEAERIAEQERILRERGPFPYNKVKVLAVGINYGANGIPALSGAEKDATDTAALLKDRFLFEPTVLLGPAATKEAILRELTAMLSSLGPKEDFVFYFAGHGTTISESDTKRTGLIIPVDGASLTADNATQLARGLDIADILGRLRVAPGRHRFAVLDSCFSGLPAIPDLTVQRVTKTDDANPLDHPSVQLLSAGRANEIAKELPNGAGGIFSHELREALKADKRPQSLKHLYEAVRDGVVYNRDYLALAKTGEGARVATPQHRTFIPTPGDFVFIPTTLYKAWEQAKTIDADVEGYLDTPVTYQETKAIFEKLGAPPVDVAEILTQLGPPASNYAMMAKKTAPAAPPPAIPEKDMKRYEARAAMGDPEALTILTALASRSPDPAVRRRGFEYAFTAYETKQGSGQTALGLVYAQGVGTERRPEAAKALLAETPLKKEIAWLTNLANLAANLAAYKEAKTPLERVQIAFKILGQVRDTKLLDDVIGGFKKLFTSNPKDKAIERLASAKKSLASTPATAPKAKEEIAAAIADIKKTPLADAIKTDLTQALGAVIELIDKNEIAAAGQRLDDVLGTIAGLPAQ